MERTYKKIEVVGVSQKSFAEATQNAVASTPYGRQRPTQLRYNLKSERREEK